MLTPIFEKNLHEQEVARITKSRYFQELQSEVYEVYLDEFWQWNKSNHSIFWLCYLNLFNYLYRLKEALERAFKLED